MIYPTEKEYGYTNTFATAQHYDLMCQVGTMVFAPEAGRITFAGIDNYGARTIIIENGNRRWEIGHFSELKRFSGDVREGEWIGKSGGWPPLPGEQTTGPHLHVRFLINNISQDWVKILKEAAMPDYSWLEDLGNPGNPNTVVHTHINPSLMAVGESTDRPLSERVKVVCDYVKQVPTLKSEIEKLKAQLAGTSPSGLKKVTEFWVKS
jgi:murein DD-endopeptidase MepM/ murein hydrolase activator NlpD